MNPDATQSSPVKNRMNLPEKSGEIRRRIVSWLAYYLVSSLQLETANAEINHGAGADDCVFGNNSSIRMSFGLFSTWYRLTKTRTIW